MAKAYDRLSWLFIKDTLHSFGIQGHTNDLIMECIPTPSMSVLINGKPEGWFRPGRGIRQGCPLSPYIFILCTEVFSHIFYNYEVADLYHGVRINRCAPTVSHLLFADDSLIFCHATASSLACVQEILHKFSEWSGEKINYDKSSILFSRHVAEADRNTFAGMLHLTNMASDQMISIWDILF
ncbi:uncharacterized protein M6B38_274565 [Iris pallida]|uniref:Reverse transcriptase domain-containing protein n=1 Tax=Iris pallida TaxID=29817 RepID=A0AAX6I606_IRIPA|nr:uncharacterized protein M6B38_274565 [Iris pallida]